jgi:arylsulfatase A-like enzyme
MIDDHIGRVVQALKDTGQYDNTVIIFTSDHGDYLGDFNLMLKGPVQLPAITRVPMIWSDPDTRAGVRTDAMASTIDISASILDRAGFAPYNGIQGRSFLGALDGIHPHRDEVLIEHNDGGPRMGFQAAARARTLRTKKWRFSVFAGEDWGELYDLETDPRETKNLWDNPAYATDKAVLSLRLIDHLTFQMDESPSATRLA